MNNLQAIKPKNSISIGSIFQLGEHILACGDSCDSKLVSQILKGQQVALVASDPPYGVAYIETKEMFNHSQTKHKAILNDHAQTDAEYREFTKKWILAVKPFLAKKNSLYIFNSDKMIFSLREGMLAAGCYFSQIIVWVKSQPVLGRLDYLPQHELVGYGWLGTHKFYKSKSKSVLFYPKPSHNKLHPTQKPIPLMRELILNSSKIGDTVYEPFCGSGSTLLAAEDTKRKCIAIELDPQYCQVIIDRFEKQTGIKAKKIS